jgi:hypothetical protein
LKPFNKQQNMKLLIKTLTSFALACALLSSVALQANAASVIVDNTSPWTGWMNVSELPANGGAYLWGSGWGVGDLRAVISGPTLTLSPNVNNWNPADPYWVTSGGQPNKSLEANFYVDAGTSFAGTSLTFSGDTIANTLVAPYSSVAVIKEFTSPGYGWVGMTSASLVGGSPFSVTRTIGAGNIAQYGFMTVGPVADPATVGNFGFASITVVPEPATAVLVGMGFLGLLLHRPRRG